MNLTDPVELIFEIQETEKNLIAAYWDFTANGELLQSNQLLKEIKIQIRLD